MFIPKSNFITMVSTQQVLSMIAANEEVPDIEKLERQEFILDIEEHERLKVNSDGDQEEDWCTSNAYT